MTGLIVKALSGFYYVDCGGDIIQCKPRGKFRYEKVSPLVGDRVDITPTEPGKGRLDTIHPRKNQFQRPAVANMDQMILIASQAIPVTDPFLIDRVAAIAELKDFIASLREDEAPAETEAAPTDDDFEIVVADEPKADETPAVEAPKTEEAPAEEAPAEDAPKTEE